MMYYCRLFVLLAILVQYQSVAWCPSCRKVQPVSLRVKPLASESKWYSPKSSTPPQPSLRKINKKSIMILVSTVLITSLFPPKAVASALGTVAPIASTQNAAVAAVSQKAPMAIGRFGGAQTLSWSMELQLSFRLLFAAIAGAFVGWERSASNHSAGVRTMSLVSLGAAAYTVCSMYGFLPSQKFDPSRMASNVASGVGFIGAGVITTHTMRAKNKNISSNVVHGLTTAAAIWISAAMGVASGVGLFYISGTIALATIMILRFGRVKHTNFGRRIGYVSKKPSLPSMLADLSSETMVSEETHDLSTWDEGASENSPSTLVGDDVVFTTSRKHQWRDEDNDDGSDDESLPAEHRIHSALDGNKLHHDEESELVSNSPNIVDVDVYGSLERIYEVVNEDGLIEENEIESNS